LARLTRGVSALGEASRRLAVATTLPHNSGASHGVPKGPPVTKRLGMCHTRSEKEGTKPPYVCPGCSNHTHGNNMINRCNVINKRVLFLT
jgi:hypothetical protein